MRIITRHVWPLCISSLVIRVTLDMAGIILTAAGLGFLGLTPAGFLFLLLLFTTLE